MGNANSCSDVRELAFAVSNPICQQKCPKMTTEIKVPDEGALTASEPDNAIPGPDQDSSQLPPVLFSFATHNEDPRVELALISHLAERRQQFTSEGAKLRVAYVAGCGTHAIAMASSPRVATIDAIDKEHSQVRKHCSQRFMSPNPDNVCVSDIVRNIVWLSSLYCHSETLLRAQCALHKPAGKDEILLAFGDKVRLLLRKHNEGSLACACDGGSAGEHRRRHAQQPCRPCTLHRLRRRRRRPPLHLP